MRKVKITVLKKEFYADFADEYLTDGQKAGPCPILEEGDSFIYEGSAEKPEGFCSWAWVDIYKTVSSIAAGATHKPWNNRDGLSIVCCTDGVRPVVFRVEAMNETFVE